MLETDPTTFRTDKKKFINSVQDRNANEAGKLISEIPMVKLKFKVLVQLYTGDNEIKFDFLGVKVNKLIS